MEYYRTNELYHHGILGQKWGVRRYQNQDGTLTEAGKKRYYNPDGSYTEAGKKKLAKEYQNKLNQIESGRAVTIARAASIQKNDEYYKRKIEKAELAGKKVDDLLKKREIGQKRLTELAKEFDNYGDQLDVLLNSLISDSNVVFATRKTEYGTDRNKTAKQRNQEYKTNKGEYYYQSATGTHYKVRSATNRRKNSKKYNGNKMIYRNTPIRTEYYVY